MYVSLKMSKLCRTTTKKRDSVVLESNHTIAPSVSVLTTLEFILISECSDLHENTCSICIVYLIIRQIRHMTFPERLAPFYNTLKCFITSSVLIRVGLFSFQGSLTSWSGLATSVLD